MIDFDLFFQLHLYLIENKYVLKIEMKKKIKRLTIIIEKRKLIN